ncbi:MAG: hypothetical protein KAG26_01135 [Methylococcales bacterium]|nr:hypothetical protein [Methylococcales bacterium]
MDEMEEQIIPILIFLGIWGVIHASIVVIILYAIYKYVKKFIKKKWR